MSVLWIGQPDPRPKPAAAGSGLAVEVPYEPVEPVSRRGRHRKAGRVSHRRGVKSRLAKAAPVAAALSVGAFIYATALPGAAAAASSVMFYATDNGGSLYTTQQVHTGEVVFHAGVAYRVVFARPFGTGHTVFRTVPAVASSGVFTAHG